MLQRFNFVIVMDKLYYLYYRLFNYYKKGDEFEISATIQTYLCITGLLWINVSTILFFFSSIFYDGNNLLDRVFTDNSVYNRFIITPLLIAPIFLIIFFLINKRIKQKFEEFKTESNEEKKKHGVRIVMYIIISFLMFILSITSPLYL